MKEVLETYVEQQAEKAENLSFCSGMKLLHIRNSVEKLLNFIGRGKIFEEYTLHNISHIDEMLKIVEWLIPEQTKNKMTSAEWLMLTLAIYFHDLGMVVTTKEYDNRNNTLFKDYKNKIIQNEENIEYNEYIKNQDDHFLYQEFVREHHAQRIKLWIEGNQKLDFGDGKDVFETVNELLGSLDKMFKKDLALICESHHNDDIDDFEKYKVSINYGNSDNEKVNLDYIAIILRIADLLHITKDRTPSISRKMINVNNPTSVIEWEKQAAVRAVKPKSKRDDEGNVNGDLLKDTIEITAYFDGAETAEAYFGLSAYLQYARQEIAKCNKIVMKAQEKEGIKDYIFPWKNIDESKIETVGFETKKLQFTIDQDNILQLLVGHTLYNDSSVVVRELVQNAIDAVKLQKCYDTINKKTITDGEIKVEWNSKNRELSFCDNGTGMTIEDIENYLLKVGKSKYRDEKFRKDFPDFCSISHFGIGILTCFMVSNNIEIITNSEREDEANIIDLRKVNGKYLLKKIEKSQIAQMIQHHGTIIKLHIRSDVDMTRLEDDLKKWIILPEIPVTLYSNTDKDPIQIGYNSLKDVLINYLSNLGINIDGIHYDVFEKTQGNVTVAYAVKYLKYLYDWTLLNVNSVIDNSKKVLPIGTCVEGIRVEFTTPGYKNSGILSIANIQNSKYQTNVARSAIELDGNKEILSKIYNVYRDYIQEQMDQLESKEYSKLWVIDESSYLMKSLLPNEYRNSIIDPIDENILKNSLSQLKCIILENSNKRNIISASELLNIEKVNIIDSKMTRAAEYLLKEISCETTLNNLIEVVCSDANFMNNADNVFCNYNKDNILHQYALSNKEVVEICVNRKQRRINVSYASSNDLWYKFNLKNRSNKNILNIPKKEFMIVGLEDEIGVKTFGDIYLSSDSNIYNYIIDVVQKFLQEDTKENRLILEVFLSYVFTNNILEAQYKQSVDVNYMIKHTLEDRAMRVSDELLEKMWKKIDVDEFAKIILMQNYTLYSVYNWSRKDDIL